MKNIKLFKNSMKIRHCEKIRWTKMAQDFSHMTRRKSAGILGVFQALTTKSYAKKTSQIVQIIILF